MIQYAAALPFLRAKDQVSLHLLTISGLHIVLIVILSFGEKSFAE